MESPELPECPVCLSPYNGDHTIPRVLSCGHSTCENCLKNLPQKYPLTIRCPTCTQLIKFPNQGPSFLPKNIDLLRLIPNSTKPPNSPKNPPNFPTQLEFAPRLWSDGFYSEWKNWVIPEDGVAVEDKEKACAFLKKGDSKVRLFGVADGLVGKDSVFQFNYVARVLNLLFGLEEKVIEELRFVLNICSKCRRVCKAYGLWLDLGDGVLYLVCEALNGAVLDHFPRFENGLGKELVTYFSMMAMEMCEIVLNLHLENLFLGCLSLSCFELDVFGRVNVNLTDILLAGKTVRIAEKDVETVVAELFRNEIFMSPEVLCKMLKKDGLEYSVLYRSDVWSLACVLLRLLIGKPFIDELADCVKKFVSNGENCSDSCSGLIEKVSSLLGSKLGEELEPLQQILCRCLNFDPETRPSVIDLWKCVRELIIGHQFETMLRLDDSMQENNKGHCLVLGELPLAFKKSSSLQKENGENSSQSEETMTKRDFTEGILNGNIKVKEMKGHLDSITGLAIGGGFLFSCSFDKSVRVWSLEDFSHVHTFKGHEHKVTSVIYADEGEPLCISADSEGCIFLWSVAIPLKPEPLMKFCEEKDWRYSGIQALTVAGNGLLYTGSGDRSIKAWSLEEGTLMCTMKGHKSVVSTLASGDGVLCSGSWDGTIRLWSLSDHSLLTVLGEGVSGTIASIMSLVVHQKWLVAGHDNGQIKIWRNDEFMKSIQEHGGAVFAVGMDGKRLFTGGLDKSVNVQELSGGDFELEIRPIGSIPGSSVVSSLAFWQGKLFVGYGDRIVKVYYYGE